MAAERFEEIIDDFSPQWVYHPEGQAILIHEAQGVNGLRTTRTHYLDHQIEREWGMDVVVLNGRTKLLIPHVRMPVLQQLQPKDPLLEIETIQPYPEANFGRDVRLVAAVVALHQRKLLYKSPMFDFNGFWRNKTNSK